MKTGWIAAALAAATALTVPALAQMDTPREGRRMAAPMTRAEVEAKVKDRFAKMDLNRDGAVTKEEVGQMREQRREQRRDRAFAMLDADKNGSISRDEFEARAAKRDGAGAMRQGMMRKRMMRRAVMAHAVGGHMFARADANNDGRVTLNEALTPAMAAFDRADGNRDGTVTPEERRDARMKMREEWRAKRG